MSERAQNCRSVTLSTSRDGASAFAGNRVTPVGYDSNMRSVVFPELEDLDGLGAGELEAMLREVDMIRRAAEVMAAEIVGAAERTVAYGE
ncbi:MAG: hypothetical protein QOJ74_2394, partial [Ilumatobacteraceae bacterium]|nr:hypothetical protein [Ilumatobacteraceae bacterium]